MKKGLIFIIKTYQKIPFSCHNSCRYIPSCSNYAIEAIERYGSIKGLYLTIKRLLRCTPWNKPGYDPVPYKEIKNEKIA